MRVWAECLREPLVRKDLTLHAVKPDKLFEYYALYRMLRWLWQNGFVENPAHDEPIAHYRYSLETRYPKFRNEERCANTYHLIRTGRAGRKTTEIGLYYQLVLYSGTLEENGIDVQRVG